MFFDMKILLVTFFVLICLTNAQLNKKIGEGCTKDSDCMNTWSYCHLTKKQCACIDGFAPNSENKCKPNKAYCPSFIYDNGTVVSQNPTKTAPPPCQSKFITGKDGSKMPGNNCTATNNFCFIHSNAFTQNGLPFGHCCPTPTDPKVKLSIGCPTTDTTSYICPDQNKPGNCPKVSHNCYNDIPNSQIKSCCPISCRGDTFEITGTGLCFTKKDYEDECTYNAECPDDAHCWPMPILIRPGLPPRSPISRINICQ